MPAWPPALRAGSFDAMLNFEIGDHPIYDGLELQWFDDVTHGTGMLALLTRRDTHVVDCYAQPGLRLDPADYQIGAGIGVWVETEFADARLEVFPDSEPAAEIDDAVHRELGGALPNGVVEAATAVGCTARLEFDPPLPQLTALSDGGPQRGRWSVAADGTRLTGGRWFAERRADGVRAGLDVTERWRPRKLPLLMRVVTTVVPVFRRWHDV